MKARPGEVEVTQYLRPHGKKRKMFAEVGEEFVKMAEGQVLSAEELMTGQVAVYSRLESESDEDEILELATNGPGPNNPTEKLKVVIAQKHKQQKK